MIDSYVIGWLAVGVLALGWGLGSYMMYRHMLRNQPMEPEVGSGKETRRLAQYQEDENLRWIRGGKYQALGSSLPLSGTYTWPTVPNVSPYAATMSNQEHVAAHYRDLADWAAQGNKI